MKLNRPWVDFGFTFTHAAKRFVNPEKRKLNFNVEYSKLLLTLMTLEIPIYILDQPVGATVGTISMFPFLRKYKGCKVFYYKDLYRDAGAFLSKFNTDVNLVTSKIGSSCMRLAEEMQYYGHNPHKIYVQMNWCSCNYFDDFSVRSYTKYKEDLLASNNVNRHLQYEYN